MTRALLSDEDIFQVARRIEAGEVRATYLGQVCGEDGELRNQLDQLLRAHDESQSFLEEPAPEIERGPSGLPTLDRNPQEKLGTLIGRYKLLEQVGEGGMGVVYVAEQTEPVRRRVALKIIKPGMDTKQVIARFEAERQALAMMDHPHIARILDAGTTGEGTSGQEPVTSDRQATGHWQPATGSRPYFVMELVRGMPITEYCDKARLSPRQRLKLFIDVCHAVQHAHQKGVIHRDLKPSNVMVTVHDARPVAKVIDFGVAKAVGQQLTERTVYTAHTQLVGTPLYMSPEQADFSSQDVDTRSDVYSLGVLLYELLTGQTPFDKETLTKAGFDEMRRIIREDEPPCPSRRFSTLSAQAISTVSQHRSVDERHLGRVLRGELDWIVMKALEKDRSRRYESASALAADIQRYLSDEPVLACPPTTMYRFHKFARKHKPALATAAAIALCLLLGTTVSAWQAVRATTAEAEANANEQKAVANEQKANANAAAAEQKEQEALKQRDEMKTLNEKLQHTLYIAHMNMARHAWEAGAIDQMEELLEQHRPKSGDRDLRAFEWYYLHRQRHGQLLTLKGHTDAVLSVAYSPDGKLVASGSRDDTVKVWDTATGREILTFSGHSSAVRSVAFSPNGKQIASASGEEGDHPKPGELKIWDAATGKEQLALKGHAGVVSSVTFSPDGKRVASADWVGAIKVWDAQSGQELISLKGHNEGIHNVIVFSSVVFSPDGKRLASAHRVDFDGSMRVWDSETGQELVNTNSYGNLSFSPDGKRLTNAYSVMDAETGKALLTISRKGAQGLLHSPNGKRLAGTSGDKIIRIYDSKSGQELFSIKGNTGGPGADAIAYSPDSKRLAVAAESGTVKIFDATASPEAGVVSGHRSMIQSMAYSPDGKYFATGSNEWTVLLRDAKTGQAVHTLKGTGPVQGVSFSPDGRRLASASGEIKLWDTQTGQEILKIVSGGHRVTFSPDGKRLAGSTGTATAKLWDAETGKELLELKGHSGKWVSSLAFSPDGRRLATGGSGETGEVKIWDTQSGQELLTLQKRVGGGVRGLAFSAEGQRLVTGTGSGEVKVWDTTSGQEVLSLKGHVGMVGSVAFSPDGKRIAAQSQYSTVKIWDAQTGQETLSLKSGIADGLSFSPDGRQLAAGAANTAFIYDATPLPEKP